MQVVMSSHPSDRMSQSSQVSRVTLQCCEDSDCQFGQTEGPTDQGTRSPIELFWTAKNLYLFISHCSPFNWRRMVMALVGKRWRRYRLHIPALSNRSKQQRATLQFPYRLTFLSLCLITKKKWRKKEIQQTGVCSVLLQMLREGSKKKYSLLVGPGY